MSEAGAGISDQALEALARICGAGGLLTGADAAPYGRDWRGQYPSQPLAVVRPGSTDQVSQVMALASDLRLPVVPMGGNTGLVGGTHADAALVLSLERMNRIRAIDAAGRSVAVDAGVIVEQVNSELAPRDLFFPLSFGAQGSAQIGGVLSTNAGGANVLAHGMSRALCLGLEVVLPDGQVLNDMNALRKNNTGYDLKQLFIGAEGSLGVITGAVLGVIERPAAFATSLVAVSGIKAGLACLARLRREAGHLITAFEIMPRSYLARLREAQPHVPLPLPGDPEAVLLIEFSSSAPDDCRIASDGSEPLAARMTDALAGCIEAGLVQDAVIAGNEQQRRDLWRLRDLAAELSIGLTPVVAADVSVPLARIAEFVPALDAALSAADPEARRWIFGHLGDGNMHVVHCPENKDPAHLARMRAIIDAQTTRFAGSFSAEHGIGIQKLTTMRALKDPVALKLMARIKQAFDPLGIMNPGKVVPDL